MKQWRTLTHVHNHIANVLVSEELSVEIDGFPSGV